MIPEFYPPARAEAWLTLPPGVVVARDADDYEPRYCEEPWYPTVRSEVARRFRAKFGNQAAFDWDLEPEQSWLLSQTLKEVFCSSGLQKQFYVSNPFLQMT